MPKFHVYVLTLVKSGIFYIGSTSQLDKRLNRHLRELKNKTHYNLILSQNYELNDEIIINSFEMDTREKAYEFEEKFINKVFNSPRKHLLANISLNAKFGDSLTNHPDRENIIHKRQLTQKEIFGKLSENELKQKFGRSGSQNGMYGRKHTLETRRKISLMHKGHSYNKGCKLSPEHIEKIRQRQKLRTGSKNSFFGRKHTEETRKKLSEINKANPNLSQQKRIMANGVEFESHTKAAKFFRISLALVGYRIKSKKYDSWYELE